MYNAAERLMIYWRRTGFFFPSDLIPYTHCSGYFHHKLLFIDMPEGRGGRRHCERGNNRITYLVESAAVYQSGKKKKSLCLTAVIGNRQVQAQQSYYYCTLAYVRYYIILSIVTIGFIIYTHVFQKSRKNILFRNRG